MLKKKIEIIVNMIKEQLSNADIISIVNVEEALLNVVRFLLSSDATTVEALLNGCGYGNLVSAVKTAVPASILNGVEAIREFGNNSHSEYLNLLKMSNASGKKIETIFEAIKFDSLNMNDKSKIYSSFVMVYFENEELCKSTFENINLILPKPQSYHPKTLVKFLNMEKAYYIAKREFENANPLSLNQLAYQVGCHHVCISKYIDELPQIKKYLRKRIRLSQKSVESGASIAS